MRYKFFHLMLGLLIGISAQSAWANPKGHENHILAQKNPDVKKSFDIIHAKVTTEGSHLVFQQETRGDIGTIIPKGHGALARADVYSYVWPTNLNSSAAGFEADQGILALVLTSHPDFDDTPLYDENKDGNKTNDGALWHSHWVVLTKDDACGKDALKVKDIPENTTPKLPATWPKLPIFIDSPGYDFSMKKQKVLVRVPLKDIGFPDSFKFDAVTAGLRVHENVHAPLLCVVNVWDIGSGDLSLTGKSE